MPTTFAADRSTFNCVGLKLTIAFKGYCSTSRKGAFCACVLEQAILPQQNQQRRIRSPIAGYRNHLRPFLIRSTSSISSPVLSILYGLRERSPLKALSRTFCLPAIGTGPRLFELFMAGLSLFGDLPATKLSLGMLTVISNLCGTRKSHGDSLFALE